MRWIWIVSCNTLLLDRYKMRLKALLRIHQPRVDSYMMRLLVEKEGYNCWR